MTTGVESLRAWEAVRRAAKKEHAAILAGLPNARGSLREATERLLGWVHSSDAPPRDAVLQGALGALALGRLRDDLTPAWLSLGGPSFAIACAAHERKVIAVHPRKAGTLDLGTRWLEPRTAEQTDITLDVPTWETLAKAFRAQKKDERAAARAEVRDAREGAHPALAVWLDTIAQLPEEAVDDLAFAEALPEPAWRVLEPWLTELVPSLALLPRDLAKPAALVLIERVSPSALGKLAAHAKPLVEIVGPSGAPSLMRLLTDAHKSPFPDTTSAKKLANALATLDDPSVLAFFERHLSSRLLGVVAAEIVAKKSADAEKKALAVELHEVEVAAKATRSTRAKKVSKARAVVQKSEEAVAQAITASPEQIPWILREPPWRGPSIPPLHEASEWIDVPFEEKLHLLGSDSEGLEGEDVDDDPIGLLATRGLSAVSSLLEWPANRSAPALRRVESPRVAARLLEVLPSRRRLVEGYFTQYPVASALALLPLSLSRSSSATSIRLALEALSGMWSSGCDAELRSVALSLGQGDVVDQLGRAARLLDGPSASPHLPVWCSEFRWPTVLLAGGERLPPEAVRAVLELMTSIEVGKPSEGVIEIRSACDKTSLDAFLCALLAAWSRAKAWDDVWVLPSVAALGGLDSVRGIVALIREWAKERTTWPHALDAVSALEAAGTGATAALSGLIRKGSRTIAERAELVLRSIAKREGLTADERADLGTPTLELDSDGLERLDFGLRSFVVEVGDDLAPVVLDGNRRRVPTLRTLKSDDPTLAAASLARMRSLKKGLGEVARSAASRLERSMVEGRTFRVSHFEGVVLAHPILGRLARRLVWQRRPLAREKLGANAPFLFRVAEDGTLASLSDATVSLGRHDEIRLAHPLEMEATATAQAWLDVLADYELIQPFPQLARTVFTPLPSELEEGALTRYRGRAVLQMAIQGRLLARGWERADEGNQTTALVRRVRRHVAHYALVDPIVFGEPFKSETTLGVVTFGVPLSEVPPMVFSEVAYHLDVLGDAKR